jgi:hypothetical protein
MTGSTVASERFVTGAIRAFGRVAAFGNRMLRVVYYDAGTEYRIITVFFDRRASRRRPIP